MIISFEGIDKSGKSSISTLLHGYLVNHGKRAIHVREPGGTEQGEKLRAILKQEKLDVLSEVYLLAASRHLLIDQRVKPALEDGYIVICDRYFDSSLVYQGCRGMSEQEIWNITKYAVAGYRPTVTFLLDIPVEVAVARGLGKDGELDKVEDRGLDYFRRVRDRYLERAWDDKNRWHVIDATLKEQEVFNQVSEIIDFILRQPPVFG